MVTQSTPALVTKSGGMKYMARGVSNVSTASPPHEVDDSSLSDSSGLDTTEDDSTLGKEGPRQRLQPSVPEEAPRREAEKALPKSLLMHLWHYSIFYFCIVVTRIVLGIRSFFALFFYGAQTQPQLNRPKEGLTWEVLSEAADPVQVAKEFLPVPPPFPTPPPEGMTLSFGPCANLMIYTGGVAACLQRCPNYAEISPRLRFYGVSCGAFIAATLAADCDMMDMLPEMLSWTQKFQRRLWGLVGAYSDSISRIVWDIFSDPARFARARNRLGVGITVWKPHPERVQVQGFSSAAEVVTSVLGSCYIPVAFETPMWSSTHGPLWDGGIFEFATQGDMVFSPWEVASPDVMPAKPYPKAFSFFPPHQEDAVKIFEDGYMDCLRWLQAGAPTRKEERDNLADVRASGMEPLWIETKRVIYELIFGAK